MAKALGTIKEIDLRNIFQDEARDLTPWLAQDENLSRLSEEIGVEIKLVQMEASVGRFNVDILAVEETSGKKIVIENQLETTDHDHLGKIITYASGHDAAIIIWIFKDIREEHRQAIDWLNDHTDDDLDFFAVKLQLWQIDDSRPAPKFEIIASPNEWAKTIRNKAPGEMTDTKLQQLEFWTKFKDWVHTNDKKLHLQTPRPQHWYNVSMGSSGLHISLTVNTKENLLACEVYINNNKELFSYFQDQKESIEKNIGGDLEWIEASKATRIKMTKDNFDIQSFSDYERYFVWLHQMVLKFKMVFVPLIKEFER